MKTHKIVYQHFGEISYTPKDPWKPLADVAGTIDLSAKVQKLVSFDMWALETVDLYQVVEVGLPDWMDPREFCRESVAWKYTWMVVPMDWPEHRQRALKQMGEAQRAACATLLKTRKFRSPFRASLRQQLEKWLDTPVEERAYPTPFSRLQWANITRPA